MKKVVFWVCFIGLFLILIRLTGTFIYYHPFRLFHPCPTLTTKFPILRNLDRMLMLTAGWDWYKVKDKSTGKPYIIKFGWDKKNKCEDIRIWDVDTRKESRITREQYFSEYEDIGKTGIGQWEQYPKDIDEAIELYNKGEVK